jgi:hypothetical protein
LTGKHIRRRKLIGKGNCVNERFLFCSVHFWDAVEEREREMEDYIVYLL